MTAPRSFPMTCPECDCKDPCDCGCHIAADARQERIEAVARAAVEEGTGCLNLNCRHAYCVAVRALTNADIAYLTHKED